MYAFLQDMEIHFIIILIERDREDFDRGTFPSIDGKSKQEEIFHRHYPSTFRETH